jgi:glycosyltransferase involved in cell wall biosynthesis
VSWFNRHGHETCLIADAPVKTPWEGQEIVDLTRVSGARVAKFFFWLLQTRRILRQWKPDILHAHRVSSAGWLGAFSGFHPLVVTPWGSDLYLHPQRSTAARYLAHYVMGKADLVTADSLDLCRTAISYGAKPQITKTIQWGVDQKIFKPAADRKRMRMDFGIQHDPLVLSIRAVNPTYNLDTIIQAFPAVLKHFPHAGLALRVYNTSEDYHAELVRLVAQLGIEKAVHWIGPVEPWEKLAEVYGMADIAVSVPISDGTPVSVLESMACGVPVIASDLPSLREWITDQDNGFLVPLKQPAVLAARMVQLLQEPGLAETFRSKNLDLIEQRANHDHEMQKMEALYQELLRARH